MTNLLITFALCEVIADDCNKVLREILDKIVILTDIWKCEGICLPKFLNGQAQFEVTFEDASGLKIDF